MAWNVNSTLSLEMLHFVLYDMESSTVVDILKEPPHFYLYIIDICHAFVLRKPLSEWKANMNRERESVSRGKSKLRRS